MVQQFRDRLHSSNIQVRWVRISFRALSFFFFNLCMWHHYTGLGGSAAIHTCWLGVKYWLVFFTIHPHHLSINHHNDNSIYHHQFLSSLFTLFFFSSIIIFVFEHVLLSRWTSVCPIYPVYPLFLFILCELQLVSNFSSCKNVAADFPAVLSPFRVNKIVCFFSSYLSQVASMSVTAKTFADLSFFSHISIIMYI